MSAAQDAVDYSNAAQYRVVADTRCLTKVFTLTVAAGQELYGLPDDVISLLAVLDGSASLTYLSAFEALRLSTAPNFMLVPQTRFYAVGRTIGILPVPVEAHTYQIYYEARPVPLTSATELEVTGDFERAVERLVQAMKLEDDGQPELAAEEKAGYQQDLMRLRRRAVEPSPDRGRVIGFDEVD